MDISRWMATALAVAAPLSTPAQTVTVPSVAVTVDNFTRAESDLFMTGVVRRGGFGRLVHNRTVVAIEHQPVVRSNRDTLYSAGVFDLDVGPVTITLPESGDRYMSLQLIDEDHYTRGVVYSAGEYTFSRAQIGTRYVLIGIRTLLDPESGSDVLRAQALQDAVKSRQAATGRFEVPNWDAVSRKKVRDALLVLGETVPDLKHTFGTREQVLPVRHLIGTATAWGGSPEKDAMYLTVTPKLNDGNTIYKLRVRDVPVDGFWSISVYNGDGYFQANAYDAYTLNSITARKGHDGQVDVQFGGCDGVIVNCLPVTPRWNYMVRLYRPRLEVLNGAWTFPEAYPVAAASTR